MGVSLRGFVVWRGKVKEVRVKRLEFEVIEAIRRPSCVLELVPFSGTDEKSVYAICDLLLPRNSLLGYSHFI